jgi:GNAT superfamily N-acetyltransferase
LRHNISDLAHGHPNPPSNQKGFARRASDDGQPDLDNGAGLSIADAAMIFEKMKRYPNYQIYVADIEGELVGAFALLIMDNIIHFGSPSAIVEAVAVAPEWQRKGIGKAMMLYAWRLCHKAGCYKLSLSSSLKRERAYSFYESLGFEKHGFSFRVLISG